MSEDCETREEELFPGAQHLIAQAANRDINKTKWKKKRFEQFDRIREGLEEIETIMDTGGNTRTKFMRIRNCLGRMESEVVSLKRDVSTIEYTRARDIFIKSIEANSQRVMLSEIHQLFEEYLGEKK